MTDVPQSDGTLPPQVRKWIALVAVKLAVVTLVTVALIYFYL